MGCLAVPAAAAAAPLAVAWEVVASAGSRAVAATCSQVGAVAATRAESGCGVGGGLSAVGLRDLFRARASQLASCESVIEMAIRMMTKTDRVSSKAQRLKSSKAHLRRRVRDGDRARR